MAATHEAIEEDKKEYYSEDKFEMLFEQFDENKDGFLSKPELAILIKKTFAPYNLRSRE